MTFAFLSESSSMSKVAKFLLTGVKIGLFISSVGRMASLPARIWRQGVIDDGSHGTFPISLSKSNPETTNFVIFEGVAGGGQGFFLSVQGAGAGSGDAATAAKLENSGKKLMVPF